MRNLIALIAFLTVSGFVCSLSGQELAAPPKTPFTKAPPKKTQVFGGDAFGTTVQPFLKKHCIDCHGPDEQSAGIRVDRLPAGFAAEDAVLWTRVYRAIESGKMPPGKKNQPLTVDKKAVSDWILEQSRAVRVADGSGSQRRLNRREYAALITSVLKLDLPQFEKYLPDDRRINGFDTLASGLQDATASVNAAQEAIDMLLRRVDFLEPKAGPPQGVFGDFLTGKRDAVGPRSKTEMIRVVGGGLVEPHFVNPSVRGGNRGKGVEVSVGYEQADFDGFLRIRLTVASLAPKGTAPPTLRFSAEQRLQITGDADHPRTVEILILPGDRVPSVSHNKGMPSRYQYSFFFANQQTLPFEPNFVPDARGFPALPEEFNKAVKAKDSSYPASWLQFQKFEVEPSYHHQWLTAEERGSLSTDDAGAMTVIRKLASGAFRRPISSEEDRWLASFYQKCRKEELGLDDSIRLAAEMILTSAPARTLLPTDVSDLELRQYAIASRLSFGLLCRPPDTRLQELAAAGKLSEPSVLQREIDRLLDHPESMNGFLMPFATMWLALNQPKFVVMEQKDPLKRWVTVQPSNLWLFREHILAGMDREAAAYFGIMLKENLPIGELLNSDWLAMNDAMAYHYEYPRIIGQEFQKVKLRPDDPRGGGVLGQAGVMSMTTWMGPNWPTYRGVWALRHVLNHPPPPAPLEVPELDHQMHKGQRIREKLAAHTKEANCAVCHKTMDPVGFAFQHFDVSGRWQENEVESNRIETAEEGVSNYVRSGKSWTVDASGSMPRGEEFKTWKEFKQLAAAHYSEDVARGQFQRYIRYFASREPTVLDEIVLTKLLESHGKRQFPMRDMLKDFLTSETFLGRKN